MRFHPDSRHSRRRSVRLARGGSWLRAQASTAACRDRSQIPHYGLPGLPGRRPHAHRHTERDSTPHPLPVRQLQSTHCRLTMLARAHIRSGGRWSFAPRPLWIPHQATSRTRCTRYPRLSDRPSTRRVLSAHPSGVVGWLLVAARGRADLRGRLLRGRRTLLEVDRRGVAARDGRLVKEADVVLLGKADLPYGRGARGWSPWHGLASRAWAGVHGAG